MLLTPKKKVSRLKTLEERIDNEGLTWEMKGHFQKALDSYDRLLNEIENLATTSQSEKEENNAAIAYLLMRKAGVLLQTGRAEQGETLMNQALKKAEQSAIPLAIARAKLGIGVFYGSTDRFEEAEKMLKEALSSFNQSEDYDNKQGAGWVLLNLGGLYGKQRKWALAEKKLDEAISLLSTIKNWVGVASAYELKAKHNTAEGKLDHAKKDLLNAVLYFEKQGMKEKAESLRKSIENKNAQG
jgi:tetratricopeptide (TPR) repeat protein